MRIDGFAFVHDFDAPIDAALAAGGDFDGLLGVGREVERSCRRARGGLSLAWRPCR